MVPSSSGLGRRAFIPKITGSTPVGITLTALNDEHSEEFRDDNARQ